MRESGPTTSWDTGSPEWTKAYYRHRTYYVNPSLGTEARFYRRTRSLCESHEDVVPSLLSPNRHPPVPSPLLSPSVSCHPLSTPLKDREAPEGLG